VTSGVLVAPGARLVDAASGTSLHGDELEARIATMAAGFASLPAGPVFVLAPLDLTSVLRYLGSWTAGRTVALLDPGLAPETLADLIRRYRPVAVLGGPDEEAPPPYRPVTLPGLGSAWLRGTEGGLVAPHADLAVLLATSGSTGDPKLVRLSRHALAHNAAAIAASLRLDPDETAPTSLPLYYSYGLSVLNSHLAAGAGVIVVDGGVLARPFWAAVDRYQGTSLAGVPHHYEMLSRIRWDPASHASLHTLTQAGGRMRPDLIEAFRVRVDAGGGDMYVMYGQTEAAPRMTTLPAERLADKLGSVGPAVPGGRLAVLTAEDQETDEPGVTGEVIYRGPNVMMGYAHGAEDLARGDEHAGRLATGDLGHLDKEGHLWLTGRLKRIAKVFGIRVNLDDIERLLAEHGPVAAVAGPDRVVIWSEGTDEAARRTLTTAAAERLRLHRSGFDVRSIEKLPLLPSGKIDYRALEG
jgi:acyl-CoA synthetase (AMP-forming)/AMP-acid ligase II